MRENELDKKSKINNVSKPQKHENYGLSNYLEFNINALVCVCYVHIIEI